MKKRRCAKCGAGLTDEDVMKIKIEDGSWQTIPLPLCPDCFTKQMRERVFHMNAK
jgi:NAD-dependent SIR2 family protein deacetylase